MKFLFLPLLFFCFCAKAQYPGIIWQQIYGCNGIDNLVHAIKDSRSGFVFVGFTTSVCSLTAPAAKGSHDAWLIKLDSAGNKVWAYVFGGSREDAFSKVLQLPDFGYLIIGTTRSSDSDIHANKGEYDAWLLRLDAGGNTVWSKTYGGSSHDYASDIMETADGGFIVVGYTASTDGDIITNKGKSDAWLFKVNASGDILWSKTYGSTQPDQVYAICTAADGNYMLCGNSAGADGNLVKNNGNHDLWIYKTDTAGNVLWSKSYGGSNIEYGKTILRAKNGDYIISAQSESGNGDLAGNYGMEDIWVLSVNDTGKINWQKNFGGSLTEFGYSLIGCTEGGYLVTGTSNSNDHDISGRKGDIDLVTIKLDETGAIEWTKNFGGTAGDLGYHALQLADSTYMITGISRSNDKDVSVNNGNNDMWLLKIGKIFSAGVASANQGQVIVYPTFTDRVINIKVPVGYPAIHPVVYSNTGQKIPLHIQGTPGNYTLDFSGQQPGIYILELQLNKERVHYRVIYHP